jgi:hypothetical protein
LNVSWTTRKSAEQRPRRSKAFFSRTYPITSLPTSPIFDEMAGTLQDHNYKRLEIIRFRGCAKSTMASLALVLWAALEHPELCPMVIMLADTRSQASINAASAGLGLMWVALYEDAGT